MVFCVDTKTKASEQIKLTDNHLRNETPQV